MKKRTKFLTSFLSALMLINAGSGITSRIVEETVASAAGSIQVEGLDRGISAINTGKGMMVSWRFLANDLTDTVFKLYRDSTLIYTSNSSDSTCYLDASGTSNSKYHVDTLVNGAVKSSDACTMTSNNPYFQLNLSPPTSSSCTYSPNDCTVGDADGDGQYEIFLKWDPSNSQDNSKSGKTDKVYIDCLKLDGTRLWRIDLGYNIRAGAHYTQMLVADFDSDGFAELTCKTADGTVDGKGKVIGDSSKVYRNSNGYILTSPEYYTLFDGKTGAALDTVNYNPQRGTVSSWGDSYGNRVDRFLGAVAYLDGVHPSAVTMRGYYTRMTACAYDVVNKKLVQRWYFDTNDSANSLAYGDGNHNCMPADVDGDGKQEIITGSTCIDDNGKLKWCANTGHGDALHVGDLLPDRTGIEVYTCHEDKPYGVTLFDGNTGTKIFHKDNTRDTGRCCADNVWAGNAGSEFWGINYDVYNGSGTVLSCNCPAVNFLSYWDGDLEREILDGYTDSPAKISKMGSDGKITTLLSTDGYYTCNTTKGTPCLSADLFGDWREELIVRASDSKSIRIYCTPYDTDYRITTLMHDPQYRNQVAGQNIAYNQPPHTSFYLGSEKPLPSRPNVTVLGTTYNPPAVIDPLNGTLIKSLNRLDTDNYADWSIQTNLKTGDLIYGDRTFTFTEMPAALNGAEWIKAACDSKNIASDAATFTAGKAISVFVGLDTRVTVLPAWLSDWINTGATIKASNDVVYNIYQKDFSEGAAITLGTNSTSSSVVMYTVFVALKDTVSLILPKSAFEKIEAEDFDIQSGIETEVCEEGGEDVGYIENGDYIAFKNIDFEEGAKSFIARTAAADTQAYIEIYLDSIDSTPIGICPINQSGGWQTYSDKICGISGADGVHDVYLKFVGGSGFLLNINWIQFSKDSVLLKGDLNNDQLVNSQDISLLKSYLLGKTKILTSPELADINNDDRITSVDYILLKKFLFK